MKYCLSNLKDYTAIRLNNLEHTFNNEFYSLISPYLKLPCWWLACTTFQTSVKDSFIANNAAWILALITIALVSLRMKEAFTNHHFKLLILNYKLSLLLKVINIKITYSGLVG